MSNDQHTIRTPALVSRLEELRAEAKAKPPIGESATLWRATEMIDIIYQLGTITVEGVVQLQGITFRLAQGQASILQELESLGADVGTLKQDVMEIRDDTQWLKDKQAEALEKIDVLQTSVNDALNMADEARRATER